jgi:hypothetical protein
MVDEMKRGRETKKKIQIFFLLLFLRDLRKIRQFSIFAKFIRNQVVHVGSKWKSSGKVSFSTESLGYSA